jgi:hypothetical protein
MLMMFICYGITDTIKKNTETLIDASKEVPDYLSSGGSGTGSTQPREYN